MVIVEQGKLKMMFKAEQGFCEAFLSCLVTKFLLEIYFSLQVRFFHFTREKSSFSDVRSHLLFYENIKEIEKSNRKGVRGG